MTDKTAIVIGASGVLGAEIVKMLSEQGYSLVLIGRNKLKLHSLALELKLTQYEIEILDVETELESVQERVFEITSRHGDASSLIYAAGKIVVSPFQNTDLSQWTSSITVNLLGAVEALKGFSRGCLRTTANKSATVISSIAAVSGKLGLSSYAASKAALESMVKSAANEFSRRDIRVNSVQFGLIEEGLGQEISDKIGDQNFTKLLSEYPMGPARKSDAVNAVKFLVSAESRWITGTSLIVDGGFFTR